MACPKQRRVIIVVKTSDLPEPIVYLMSFRSPLIVYIMIGFENFRTQLATSVY